MAAEYREPFIALALGVLLQARIDASGGGRRDGKQRKDVSPGRYSRPNRMWREFTEQHNMEHGHLETEAVAQWVADWMTRNLAGLPPGTEDCRMRERRQKSPKLKTGNSLKAENVRRKGVMTMQ